MSRDQIVDKSSNVSICPFKIGDTVERFGCGSGGIQIGNQICIQKLVFSDGEWCIITSNNAYHYCKNFKLVEKEEFVNSKSFEVGKHYRCINGIYFTKINKGEYYQVIELWNNQVKLKTAAGNLWYSSKDFDPIAREDQIFAQYKSSLFDSIAKEDSDNKGFWQDQVDKINLSFDIAKSEYLVYSLTQSTFKINQQEEVNMSSRRVVNVQLVDDDKGLDVEFALVHDFGDRMTEDTNDVMIQELIMEGQVSDVISIHNEFRTQEVNLEIQDRTGQTVNLRPVKLKQLRWIIK